MKGIFDMPTINFFYYGGNDDCRRIEKEDMEGRGFNSDGNDDDIVGHWNGLRG